MMPLSEAICHLFTLLSRGSTDGDLFLTARAGLGQTTMNLPRGVYHYVPPAITKLLGEHSWSIHVGAAIRAGQSSRQPTGTLLDMAVLSARWSFARVYRNEAGVEFGPGSRHVAPVERGQAVRQRLLEVCPPTYLIDSAGHELHALWALETPLDLRTDAGIDLARLYRRRLAEALGATPVPDGEDLASVDVPLPGGIVKEPPYWDDVRCVHVDAARVVTTDELEAAMNQEINQ